MQIICPTWGIVLTEFPRQGLNDIKSAGFTATMLDIGGLCGYHAYKIVKWRKKRNDKSHRQWITDNADQVPNIVKPFASLFREHGFSLPLACANFLPPRTGEAADNDDIFADMLKLAQESVITAGTCGCRYVIMRPLAVGVGLRDKSAANREYYLSLVNAAKKYNLQILLEAQYRINNGGIVRDLLADPHEAATFLDELNKTAGADIFGFNMDVGTCSLLGQNMRDFTVILGERIKAVTVRDCDGLTDTPLLPFTSVCGYSPRTDWLNVIRGLREINFDGLLIMNFAGTASAASPLLKPALLQYAKAVAEHIAWQIGMENILQKYGRRVLFGAGNMCRAYMKCYGEKYPPLFTCDNNSAKWGTNFCGIAVKNPAELKNLPADCAILICNMYYREIEEQLRNMGLKNPIGFFNDEYMPSFHFERIEDMEEKNDAADWGTDAERR